MSRFENIMETIGNTPFVRLQKLSSLGTNIDAKNEPVVLFALEWCGFSRSVRKLFSQLNIEYRSVDPDTLLPKWVQPGKSA